MVENKDPLPKHLDGKRILLPAPLGRQHPLIHREPTVRSAHRSVTQPAPIKPALVKVLGRNLESCLTSPGKLSAKERLLRRMLFLGMDCFVVRPPRTRYFFVHFHKVSNRNPP